MSFSRLNPALSKQRKIELESSFILEYMPLAPENYTKVYLLGLAKATESDNELEEIALALNMDISACIDAFSYWQSQGLVNLTLDPVTAEYLEIVPFSQRIKKFSKEKYKTFNDQLHVMIKDRNILPSEYEQYYNVIETYNIEIEAMLTIIGYCIRLKGPLITYPYIIAVAKNLAEKGCVSYDRVQECLSEYDLYDKDLKAVLKALALKRNADHADRSMFLKWKSEYGFSLETIIQVAKQTKKGGINTLHMLLGRYYENHLFSIKEIDDFNANREKMYETTRQALKILGLRYDQLDHIIETYVTGWVVMGFADDALLKIADYCFRRGIRDLEGMNTTVAKFYKQGIVTVNSINAFLNESLALDEEIKKIFSIMDLNRLVTSRDRDFYKTWTGTWNTPKELIEYSAKLSKDKSNPMGYMNSILANWFDKNIKTLADAQKTNYETAAVKSPNDNLVSRNLSSEELNAMFDHLDDDDM